MIATSTSSTSDPPLRIMSLHALLYCERLFYLEEVEEIRVADANVYAGRRLHAERLPLDDETPEKRAFEVSSEEWGIFGKVDAVRRRDGDWVVYEHKKGRCRRDDDDQPAAWPSDRIQAVAYAVLVEEELGEPVRQARIRYHADNVTAFVEIDETARDDLRRAIERAKELRQATTRPPVTENERLCTSCSLAPVCLPEEERLVSRDGSLDLPDKESPSRLPVSLPKHQDRQTLHVVARKAYISRSAETLVVKSDDTKQTVPIAQVAAVMIHGHGQMTTQALHLCAYRGIAVQWMTFGGKFVAGITDSPGRVQQRIRQFAGLSDAETCLRLARQTVHAKLECQLGYILRGTRGNHAAREPCRTHIDRIRESLAGVPATDNLASLRGLEGMAAKAYFAAVPYLLIDKVADSLRPVGRTKHPPKDPFNCLLSFGYGMLFGLTHRSLMAVGLDPAFGYFHQPRSAAPPLVLDLMELFRVLLVDMPAVGSVNRGQWSESDFTRAGNHVWLSDEGRKKAIALFENRCQESCKHPHLGHAMTYARLVELEARLLEKEWSGAPGLFGQMRIR